GVAAPVAGEVGLTAEAVETARMAGRLHELGRIVAHNEQLRISASGHVTPPGGDSADPADDVPARILEPLRQHAGIVDAIRHQHEYWDGSRIPARKSGD